MNNCMSYSYFLYGMRYRGACEYLVSDPESLNKSHLLSVGITRLNVKVARYLVRIGVWRTLPNFTRFYRCDHGKFYGSSKRSLYSLDSLRSILKDKGYMTERGQILLNGYFARDEMGEIDDAFIHYV